MNNFNRIFALILITLGIVVVVGGSALGILLIIFGVLNQLKARGSINRIFTFSTPGLPDECSTLRKSIAAYWALAFASVASSIFEADSLPDSIIRFSNDQLDSSPEIVFWLLVFLGLLNIVASVALFILKSWGKNLFVFTTIGYILFFPFSGSTVITPYSGALDEASTVLVGFIICLLYFSPAKTVFSKQSI